MREAVVTAASNFSDGNYKRLCDGLRHRLGGEIVFRRIIVKKCIFCDKAACSAEVKSEITERVSEKQYICEYHYRSHSSPSSDYIIPYPCGFVKEEAKTNPVDSIERRQIHVSCK